MENLEIQAINTVRVLAADAVQKANSGHPGTPMGLATIGHVLWAKVMRYNPNNPYWPGRDRFILSCGHACMLQYAYLFLTGYDISLDDIKQFRQLNSKTPGHPEYGLTPGVEVTTGPLGQGFANGVGMGIAQKMLAAKYNQPDFPVFDYHIYTICSDGDLMEGITAEAASLAGHLGLGNLIYLYDDNHITIEGSTSLAFSEDVAKRFESYHWHVEIVEDGNDIAMIQSAMQLAKAEWHRPSLIIVRTVIAYGSPNKAGTAEAHGSPLGEEEVRKVKTLLGFDPDVHFEIPADVLAYYREKGDSGMQTEQQWQRLWERYKLAYPALSEQYEKAAEGQLPDDWDLDLPLFRPQAVTRGMATRKASGKAMMALASKLPMLVGGAADLSPSTGTHLEGLGSFSKENPSGRNLHFGIREHAMGAILNGIQLTRGFKAYGATFLIFSDYMRPPIRLAAIMQLPSIFIFTHDSIGLGEDGTTHQPVEQLACLRAVPNLMVIRPADANETVQAWRMAIKQKDGPVALILTRQEVPVLDQEQLASAKCLCRGAYILSDPPDGQAPQALLMGSGSEVHLLLEAQVALLKEDIQVRVLSFPSFELFEKQPQEYKEKVLPLKLKLRVAVEAASPTGWHPYVGDQGVVLGINKYGESAPGKSVMHAYGFTAENIVQAVHRLFEKA